MASARKTFTRQNKVKHLPATVEYQRALLMRDLLDGTIQAEAMVEVRDGRGNITRIDYDDPDG